MRIAIDIREACHPRPTGKGVWIRGCLQAMLRTNHEFLLLSDREVPSTFSLGKNSVHRFPAGLQWHFRAAAWVRRERPDAYLSPTSYLVPAMLHTSVPCVPVVHDLIAFRGEPHDRKAVLMERLLLPRAVARAAHICCVSDTTAHDLLARFPNVPKSRITSVYAGPLLSSPSPRASGTAGIVCIATLCPRKNQLRLIRAYAALPQHLRDRHPLLLAGGRGWHDQDIVDLARTTPGVTWLEYVTDTQYNELLSACAVFAYPSLYEGFGLPVLDALQRGVPVLTSRDSALAETAGDAALLVDPQNVASISAGLERLLTDTRFCDELAEKGPRRAAEFSWDRTAGKVLDVLSRL
jgi:glycosyltransferase involved in cell wall biosynthesis